MTHKDLDVWKQSMELAVKVHRIVGDLPAHDKYAISGQLKRASMSIPSNIAEGVARNSSKDYLRFLHIASGSLAELETQLILIHKLGLSDTAKLVEQDIKAISKMMYGLKKAIRKKI